MNTGAGDSLPASSLTKAVKSSEVDQLLILFSVFRSEAPHYLAGIRVIS
jgi:hypothetical protein